MKKPMTKKELRNWIEFWQEEIDMAIYETVKRVRYAFPELDEPALGRMAAKHPPTELTIRKFRAKVARYKRMLRSR